jgi:hypothetical protein
MTVVKHPTSMHRVLAAVLLVVSASVLRSGAVASPQQQIAAVQVQIFAIAVIPCVRKALCSFNDITVNFALLTICVLFSSAVLPALLSLRTDSIWEAFITTAGLNRQINPRILAFVFAVNLRISSIGTHFIS